MKRKGGGALDSLLHGPEDALRIRRSPQAKSTAPCVRCFGPTSPDARRPKCLKERNKIRFHRLARATTGLQDVTLMPPLFNRLIGIGQRFVQESLQIQLAG